MVRESCGGKTSRSTLKVDCRVTVEKWGITWRSILHAVNSDMITIYIRSTHGVTELRFLVCLRILGLPRSWCHAYAASVAAVRSCAARASAVPRISSRGPGYTSTSVMPVLPLEVNTNGLIEGLRSLGGSEDSQSHRSASLNDDALPSGFYVGNGLSIPKFWVDFIRASCPGCMTMLLLIRRDFQSGSQTIFSPKRNLLSAQR